MTWRIPLLIMVFAVALAVGMIVFWPLRAGLAATNAGSLGLSARDVTGTIWSGRLEGAALGVQPLGDLRARVCFLPLLGGETRLSLTGEGAFQGVFIRRGDAIAVEALDMRAPISALGLSGSGTVTLSQAAFAFDSARCEAASGRARIEGLAGSGWTAPMLEGPLACEEGRLVARLHGQDAAVDLAATLAFDRSGRWTMDLVVRPADPLISAALLAQGFQTGPQGLIYSTTGRLA